MKRIVRIIFDNILIIIIFSAAIFLLFEFIFIFPNLHDVSIVPDNQSGYYLTKWQTDRVLSSDWVLLGFRNLGIVIGGVGTITGIIWGIHKLYKWSHK